MDQVANEVPADPGHPLLDGGLRPPAKTTPKQLKIGLFSGTHGAEAQFRHQQSIVEWSSQRGHFSIGLTAVHMSGCSGLTGR